MVVEEVLVIAMFMQLRNLVFLAHQVVVGSEFGWVMGRVAVIKSINILLFCLLFFGSCLAYAKQPKYELSDLVEAASYIVIAEVPSQPHPCVNSDVYGSGEVLAKIRILEGLKGEAKDGYVYFSCGGELLPEFVEKDVFVGFLNSYQGVYYFVGGEKGFVRRKDGYVEGVLIDGEDYRQVENAFIGKLKTYLVRPAK
jgi:hypothetical protein